MKKMTIEELRVISNEAKILKSDYIIFKNGDIIGTDQFITYIRRVNNNLSNVEYLSFNMKDVTDIIKLARDGDYISMTEYDMFLMDSNNNIVTNILINDKIKDIHVMDTLRRVYQLPHNDCVYDLTDNEQFMTANSGKVADGMTMIKLPYKNTYIPITVYGGYIPMNKGDKVEGRLYYNPLSPTFNVKYEITKKKGNNVIDMYSTYLKL